MEESTMNTPVLTTTRGRRLTSLVATLLMAVTLLVAAPSSASAASGDGGDGRAIPSRSCQTLGYDLIKRYPFQNPGGRVEVYYSRAKGANCVQTISTVGAPRYMTVRVERYEDPRDYAYDNGTFLSRAGAVVLLHAAGSCITIKGSINGVGHDTWKRVHCGR
jgi:hypothetical protein